MGYESLNHLYYIDEAESNKQYTNRYNAPFTEHFDFKIKEYNHNEEFSTFYCITPEILYLVNEIHSLHTNLSFIITFLPKLALYLLTKAYMIEEIQASNEIEGVKSSRKEIRDALEAFKNKSFRFSSIVSKYQKILNQEKINFDTCQDIRNFYDEFILSEVTNVTIENRPDGNIFRAGSVDITSGTQKTIHRGSFPEAKIINEMEKALKILHNEKMPSLIRIAIFHYLFGYIHPFYDGNGRTIRFITSYLLAIDFAPIVALNISLLIKLNAKSYYKMFSETTSSHNRGDLSFFITEFLHIVRNSYDNVIVHLQELNLKYRYWQSKIRSFKTKDKTTIQIYDVLLQATLFSKDGLTMQDITGALEKSINTIRSKLDNIPENQLIVDTSEKVHRYKLNLKNI